MYRKNKNASIKHTYDGSGYKKGIYLNRPVKIEQLENYFKIIDKGSGLDSCIIEVIFPSPNRSDWLELHNTISNFSLYTGIYRWVRIVPNDSNLENIKVIDYLYFISLPDDLVENKDKD